MFIGRDKELNTLKNLWKLSKAGNPQIAVILAESGFGKTRLAQEFYNWLSTIEDQLEPDGYWPDFLANQKQNLGVNPDPAICGLNNTDPNFLWWGIRISDPGRRNMNAGGALWTALQSLKPHLATLEALISGEEKRSERKIAAMKESSISLLSAVPIIGTFVGLAATGATLANLTKEEIEAKRLEKTRETSPDIALDAAEIELSEQIFLILRAVMSVPPKGLEPRPFLLLIDDAQWSDRDGSITEFCQKILSSAKEEKWPLMIMLTSWQREWSNASSGGDKDHISKIIKSHFADFTTEIKLGRVNGMDRLVKQAFPGLTHQQVELFVQRADGNPLFMNELLSDFERKSRHFKDRDLTLSLIHI